MDRSGRTQCLQTAPAAIAARFPRSTAIVVLIVALGAPCIPADANPFGDAFEPYSVILTRLPFGEEPPPPPAPPAVTPPPPPPIRPEESFARDLRLTFIVRDDSGTIRTGIVNERTKKNYFMEIDSIEDDIQLISIDYEQERVLLRHAEEEAWLSMRGQPLETGRAGSMMPANATPPEALSQAAAGSRYRRPLAPPARPGLTREEYERTRAERPAPRPPRAALASGDPTPGLPEIPEDLPPEEREQILRQYNLDLIRAGGERGPPLPFELTEAEDDQLVEEGVLPPREE